MNTATTSFESFCESVRSMAGDDKLEDTIIKKSAINIFLLNGSDFPGHIMKPDGSIEPPLTAEKRNLLIHMVAGWLVLTSGRKELSLKIELEIHRLKGSGPGR